ncbi:hypothetical protein CH380_20545 [Leptospira adleri]|uniref:Uncharacterized protein n=1 Tax=Leptospira adleri TaxID=2023186 RepID=A0A2M9YIH1_9LEPT|nr:hypothetical protein CH380_20545 [Leptospira adleri]PJZ60562.1 hypothetical protein CH376_17700 [Leptospira adleri]
MKILAKRETYPPLTEIHWSSYFDSKTKQGTRGRRQDSKKPNCESSHLKEKTISQKQKCPRRTPKLATTKFPWRKNYHEKKKKPSLSTASAPFQKCRKKSFKDKKKRKF